MPDQIDDIQPEYPSNHRSARSPVDPLTGGIEPHGGPMDRPGIEAEADMTNKPIPIANDDPEVGLTTPVED